MSKDRRLETKRFYDNKAFKRLNKKWYKKLSESGFDDIESTAGMISDKTNAQDYTYLKGPNSKVFKQYQYQNRCQFFLILSHFSHSQALYAQFPPKTHNFHKFLLQKYSDGATYRDLEKIVKTEIVDTADRHGNHPKYPWYLKSKTPIYHRTKLLIDSALAWSRDGGDDQA